MSLTATKIESFSMNTRKNHYWSWNDLSSSPCREAPCGWETLYVKGITTCISVWHQCDKKETISQEEVLFPSSVTRPHHQPGKALPYPIQALGGRKGDRQIGHQGAMVEAHLLVISITTFPQTADTPQSSVGNGARRSRRVTLLPLQGYLAA